MDPEPSPLPGKVLVAGVGNEEDYSVSSHPEDRVVHAQRAADEIHHLRKQQVLFETRHSHHHRAQLVISSQTESFVEKLA